MALFTSVVDSREPESESTWFTETSTGSHLFKITGYSFNKGIGVGNCITSDTFTVGGHEWTIRYYPDGKSGYYPLGYLAFDLVLKSDDKVKVKITLTMLSQSGGTPFMQDSGVMHGHCYETKQFEENNFRDAPFHSAGPTNLHQQRASLFERGDGTDVSFKVRGATFDAHQRVLAARSPVFRAELFGPMNGKIKVSEGIEIEDMEPSIFESMLHFIYSDSVPELDDDKATTLTLAEQHNFSELKAVCMEFLKPPEVLATVALTEGFEHMIQSCPTIREELHKLNVGDR
ncbi:hypothetical protein LUZ61_004691 [Rhynchospora tenuis]|uniref:BTB domain-containing protein n=1 Tax=Rhynchospora tenuis TaxID=198213 RepID=A0AAD5ZNB0_9POAL|nr:hypothetical protein LUZ61_004691 [Rhynchospora tenuis]